nr:hypothetical protein [Tanacetum cinerariifolium]GEZ48329.1 hypothetical protein [Tanacetum cinerariifolium]
MVQAQADMGESSAMPSAPQHTSIIIKPLTSQPQKKQKPRKSKRKDTHPSDPTINVADEALNKKSVPTHSNDPLLSGEDSIQLKELMDFCTKLQQRVIDLENTKIAQARKISSLKKRVKRLEKKKWSRTHGLKRLYKVGLSARVKSSSEESLGEENASKQGRKITGMDVDKELSLVDESTEKQGEAQNIQNIIEEVIEDITTAGIKETISIAALITTDVTIDYITLAKALEALKTSKPKIKGIVIKDLEEPSKSTTTTTTFIAYSTRPKAKGLVLQDPDDVQAKIEADFELAQRLQAEEQEQLTDDEKAKLFMEFLEKRRKFFAAKRAEEKRNKPPTKAQQRSLMCTYLKNIDGWKPKALKNKSFAEIQELLDKAMAKINNFVDFRTELVKEGSKKAEESHLKRTRDKLEQESAKKHKVDDDQEAAELKKCLEIIPDDVSIDARPLSSMSPTIIDYNIHKEGRKNWSEDILEKAMYLNEVLGSILLVINEAFNEET